MTADTIDFQDTSFTEKSGAPILLARYRACFDAASSASLKGVADGKLFSLLCRYTYPSATTRGARYVRGDFYLRDFPGSCLDTATPMTRRTLSMLADAFVLRAYGEDARRINTTNLDVSPRNVRIGEEDES